MARPAKAAGATKPTRSTRVTASSASSASSAKKIATVPAPKPSKDELRAQVEKLERTNALLRAKNRESGRIAKTAAARIAELEDQVAQFAKNERKLSRPAAAPRRTKPADRIGPQHREIDPGDAVPPGVAVQEPAPLDEEAETARDNLEEHLGHSPD